MERRHAKADWSLFSRWPLEGSSVTMNFGVWASKCRIWTIFLIGPQGKENFSWFQTIFTFDFRTARSDWALPYFNALVCLKCAGGFYQSDIWAETFFLASNAETRYNSQAFSISPNGNKQILSASESLCPCAGQTWQLHHHGALIAYRFDEVTEGSCTRPRGDARGDHKPFTAINPLAISLIL